MKNFAGKDGLALPQLFPYKSSYSFKNSDCQKFSLLTDGGLKHGQFGTFDALSISDILQVSA